MKRAQKRCKADLKETDQFHRQLFKLRSLWKEKTRGRFSPPCKHPPLFVNKLTASAARPHSSWHCTTHLGHETDQFRVKTTHVKKIFFCDAKR